MKRRNTLSIKLSQAVSLSILTAAVVAIGVTACRNKVTSPLGAKGKLQVNLTDSPARFDSVMVDIQKVEVPSGVSHLNRRIISR